MIVVDAARTSKTKVEYNLQEANGFPRPSMRRLSASLLIVILAGTTLLYVQDDVRGARGVQAVPVRTITYTVQPGDTLFAISLRHRSSVQELMTLNGLSNSVVYVGQTLNVPEPTDQLGLPLTTQITNINGQMQALPLDCEVRSAVDWAAFFGVSIDEYTFLSQPALIGQSRQRLRRQCVRVVGTSPALRLWRPCRADRRAAARLSTARQCTARHRLECGACGDCGQSPGDCVGQRATWRTWEPDNPIPRPMDKPRSLRHMNIP